MIVASDGQAGEEITDQDEGIGVETNIILNGRRPQKNATKNN